MHIEVSSINVYNYDLIVDNSEEESEYIAARVEKVRLIQEKRYEGYNIKTNNRLDGQLLIDYAMPADEGKDLLNEAANKFCLSMRAYNRILRVACTIADLKNVDKVLKVHIAEALSYRKMEFNNMYTKINFKNATSSYKSFGTHVLSIHCVPRLVDSLLFLKLIFVYCLHFLQYI
ncbi:ATP-binding protein [Candidatus Rickettsia tasmanensis]